MKNGLILKNVKEMEFFTSENLNNLGFVKHFFSTRLGGVSTKEYESLNLGIYTEDKHENIHLNFGKMFNAANMSMNRIVFLKQVHGDTIYDVNESNYNNIKELEGDAIITSTKDIAIGIFTADCVPIIVADSSKKIVGAVHAGWKGTHLKILEKVLKNMTNVYQSNPQDIYVALGPSIGKCCFEVKEDVASKFNFIENRHGKYYVDLWSENVNQALNAGVPKKNIECGNLCTMCDSKMFFSYRRDGGKTGRHGAFIQIV